MGYNSDSRRLLLTVVETRAFISAAKECMTDAERFEAITMIADNPECGDLIPGGGGIRKVRFAIGGQGKSGGVRIIYYWQRAASHIYLITVYAKNEMADLTPAEIVAIKRMVEAWNR